MTTLPTEIALALTDLKWQWAAQLRLGMDTPVISAACPGCKRTDANLESCWHSLSCMQLSGMPITDRHNQILAIITKFCQLILLPVRSEPGGMDHSSNKRADVQVFLPDRTLLGDVTIIHPSSTSNRDIAFAKGAAAVGDLSAARKSTKYDKLAASADMDFLPLVFYTYGGLHKSTINFIKRLVDSLDPAVCLVSKLEFKQALKEHLAVAVQRGNADVMIRASQRQRHGHSGNQHEPPANNLSNNLGKHIFSYPRSARPRRPSVVDDVVLISAPAGDVA
jgi:hypothetical protein